MKKITKRSLDRMRQEMVLLSEEEQRKVVGGAGNCAHGINENMMCPECKGYPVASWETYLAQEEEGTWRGGWYWTNEGNPCYAPPSTGGSSNEKITGFCVEHGQYVGTECHWIHKGGGDQYCGDHHYWYFENVGCRECRYETVTGFCEQHNQSWRVDNGDNNMCPECAGTITGYCGEHKITWKIVESECCPECEGITGFCGIHEKKWKISESDSCPDCSVITGFCGIHNKQWNSIDGILAPCPDCMADENKDDHNPPGNLPNNDHLVDGVDVDNDKHFTFNSSLPSGFQSTLKEVLKSVSTFKSILSYFDKGYINLTFQVGVVIENGVEKNFLAGTSYPTDGSFLITFNEKYITENGLNTNAISDNIGFDWSQVNSQEEALVVALVHEALHAKHRAIYNEALAQCKKNVNKLVQYLLDQGYSQEFVEIYCYKADDDQWYHYEWDVIYGQEREHQYMKKYDHEVISAALREYQRDHNLR